MASGDASACMIDRGVAPVALGQQQAESRHWVAADERDAFISWLRGEFAAANAIIDALCQHLQIVGSPSEYDFVLACIHQRRYNWNPVLHMQQYYSVAEVLFALQQVALRKQQQQGQVSLGADEHVKAADFKLRENGSGHVNGSALKQPNNAKPVTEEKQNHENGESNGLPASVKTQQEQATIGSVTRSIQGQETGVPYANGSSLADDGSPVGKETLDTVESPSPPKHITGFEEIDSQQVNVMEGLEIHEGVFDSREASRLAALVNDSHASKKKKKSGGNKRTSKAKAKEVIHFGTIPSEIVAGQSSPLFTEETAEPMPTFLESIIDRLVNSQIVPEGKRPDSCSISVLEPGDYMPPHRHNNFEQPLFILSLGSQSELVFGRNLKINSTGEADGKYKAVLPVGSVLVLQGNSAQLVQCAVSPLQSTRMLVTFGKMVKRTLKPAAPTSPVSNGTSPLSPTYSKQVNGHSFVQALPTRGFQSSRTQPAPTPAPMVVPVRTTPGQVLQTQPVIITSVGPYSPVTVVGPGWSTPPPPAITRVPSPGTGVFLPANGTVVYSNGTHHHQMNGSHRRHAATSGANFQNSHSNGVLSEKEVAA